MGQKTSKPRTNRRVSRLLSESHRLSDEAVADLRNNVFPFENLVLEGGGAKVTGYVGALQTLEKVGILQKMTRFGGASGGAMYAAFLSVRMPLDQLALHMAIEADQQRLANDASFGKLSLLPNILSKFGWNPGVRFLNHFRTILKQHCGDADITFEQAYRKYGTELCIVVTNLTKLRTEYFHVKTTPDVPIAIAVRMSISMPGLFQPLKYRDNYYVDGGLLMNYPVHCFDGWYLSMKEEDSFFHKLECETPKFDGTNENTLGILVYASDDCEAMQGEFHRRYAYQKPNRPDTKLARERGPAMDELLEKMTKRVKMVEAASKFSKILKECDVSRDTKISLEEFKMACKFDSLTPEDISLLFGDNFDINKTFNEMDADNNGEVTFPEFLRFMERRGVNLLYCIHSDACRDIKRLGDFAGAVLDALDMHVKRLTMRPKDVDRCIGIHTDYIQVADFDTDIKDKEFLFQQGSKATIAFLQQYAMNSRGHTRRRTSPDRNCKESDVDFNGLVNVSVIQVDS